MCRGHCAAVQWFLGVTGGEDMLFVVLKLCVLVLDLKGLELMLSASAL